MHLAEVILLSGWGREGRSIWTLLGCSAEQSGGWSVWPVLPRLESMPGSIYSQHETHLHPDMSSRSVMLTNNFCILVISYSV